MPTMSSQTGVLVFQAQEFNCVKVKSFMNTSACHVCVLSVSLFQPALVSVHVHNIKFLETFNCFLRWRIR